jgi:protein-disulfide isomerase
MKNVILSVIAISLLFLGWPASAASTKDEVLKLQDQVEAMQKDIEEIKKLLQSGARAAPPPPPRFEPQDATIGESPFLGAADAPVTLIEYSDYQCPFCARHYRQVMPALVSEYVETGKLRYVMRENPIPSLHREAFNASMAALCAGDQGKYWEMHNLLFDNQRTLNVDGMKGFAESLGLDTAAFNECLDSNKYRQRVTDDIAGGAKLGVSGTPGFFIGLTDSEDPNQVRVSTFIKGAQPLDNFKRAIDELLKPAE